MRGFLSMPCARYLLLLPLLPDAPLVLGVLGEVVLLPELPLDMPLLLGEVLAPLVLEPPVLDFSMCAAACSLSESLPSLSLSSFVKSFSCAEPLASSFEM